MKYIIQLMILTGCLLIQGGLEWKVLKKITDYGQNVTLFCNVSNCCPKLAGWDKYTPAQQTIFIDVKTWKPTKKYDGKVLTDGYTLIIQNLIEEDLNVSYACVYGSTIGDKQSLLEENVFNYISTTEHNGPIHNRTFYVENKGTTQQTGPIDNRNVSAGKIAGIVCGVFVAVVVVPFVIFFPKRRREMHRNIGNRNAGSNEDVPLIDPFLEEPNDIYCIEGEDAILTCKLRPDIPPVNWWNNGREIIHNGKYVFSMEDTQHKLTIKNTTETDSGDYNVQVGKFSKKIQLNITDPFLEEPNDIQCIEGEDAILTCNLRPDKPPVKWFKNGQEIIQNEKCIMSTVDTQHKLTLKTTTASDSGDYYVHVGIFSKKVQLNITDRDWNTQKECKSCGLVAVYWCNTCEKAMCDVCNEKHTIASTQHTVVNVLDKYILKNKFVVDKASICDMKMLGETVLVADFIGKQLILYNIKGVRQRIVPLSKGPRKIAIVDNDRVAVRLFRDSKVVIVDLNHSGIFEIDIKEKCNGIMCMNNKLFVGCDGDTIRVFDLNGEKIKTIAMPFKPWYICSDNENRIFCSEVYNANKVTCFDQDGKELFNISNNYMVGVTGISVDDNGLMLVSCKNSHNVHRINPNDKKSDIIISKIPGLSTDWFPYICFDYNSESVIIAREDKVYVYSSVRLASE